MAHADDLVTTPAEHASLEALRAATDDPDGPMERHELFRSVPRKGLYRMLVREVFRMARTRPRTLARITSPRSEPTSLSTALSAPSTD